MPFTLVSPAFQDQGSIPDVHTCEGRDVSPPLSWTDAPAGTLSFALVVDDPDAPDPAKPKVRWAHQVVYDIPPEVSSVAEGASPRGRDGLNDWKQPGWRGPCPPIGRHRYFFTLYALDRTLGDLGRPTKADVLHAMEGHILAQAELIGTYQKSR